MGLRSSIKLLLLLFTAIEFSLGDSIAFTLGETTTFYEKPQNSYLHTREGNQIGAFTVVQ